MNILFGKAGIIDSDIKHQLEETITFYDFNFIRINLTSEKEIDINTLTFSFLVLFSFVNKNSNCVKLFNLAMAGTLIDKGKTHIKLQSCHSPGLNKNPYRK